MSELEKLTLKKVLSAITITQAVTILTVFSGICFFIFSIGEHWGRMNEKESKTSVIEDQKRKIIEQENKWSKLEPHLILKTKFDLRKNVIHSYSRDIPTNASLLQNEIYADTNMKGLQYAYDDDISYFSDILDLKYCGQFFKDLAKSHIWHSIDTYNFSPSFELGMSISPSISLQRINKYRLSIK